MSRTPDIRPRQPWLSTLGDWRWPGTSPAGEVLMPPAWIPATPPPAPRVQDPPRARVRRRRRLARTVAATLVAGTGATALALATHSGLLSASRPAVAPAEEIATPVQVLSPLPTLVPVCSDAAGSEIAKATWSSPTLDGQGQILVYLPPGYPLAGHRYPVIYMLHGQRGHANSFLEIGTQHRLDKLTASGRIPPMIAVMIQDRYTMNDWVNAGHLESANYVIEVQELVDRMLPTIAQRSGRAIVGSSMGGHGAVLAALSHPERFAVTESWLSYFNWLGPALNAAKPVIERYGLSAFLYGAEGDTAAEPAEDPAFAAKMRAAGANAQWAIFPGNHSLTTDSEHLEAMLLFASHALQESQQRVAAEVRAKDSTLGG